MATKKQSIPNLTFPSKLVQLINLAKVTDQKKNLFLLLDKMEDTTEAKKTQWW